MKKFVKFRLFLLVALIFIGAAVFMSDPFTNQSTALSPTAGVADSIGNTVTITDEGVAHGVPGIGSPSTGINWTIIGIAVAAINLVGALVVIFMTGEEKS